MGILAAYDLTGSVPSATVLVGVLITRSRRMSRPGMRVGRSGFWPAGRRSPTRSWTTEYSGAGAWMVGDFGGGKDAAVGADEAMGALQDEEETMATISGVSNQTAPSQASLRFS